MSQDLPDQPYGQAPPPPPPPPPSFDKSAGSTPAQPAYGQPAAGSLSPADDRLWGMLAHLAWIVASIVALAPLGPLVVFLLYKDRSAFVRRQSLEALNLWITVYIGSAISFVLMLIIVGFVTLPIILVGALVLSIIAAMAANRGEDYRYPLILRLVK